jgi:hypothetical protein
MFSKIVVSIVVLVAVGVWGALPVYTQITRPDRRGPLGPGSIIRPPGTIPAGTFTTPPPSPEVQFLTDIARKIKVAPDNLGQVNPGQRLDLSLTLPPELGVGGGGAPRIRPGGPLFPPGRRIGGTAAIPTPTLPVPTPTPVVTVTPPVPTPTLPTSTPTNLKPHAKWGVFEVADNGSRKQLVAGRDFAELTKTDTIGSFAMAPLHLVEFRGANAVLPNPKKYEIVATVSVSGTIPGTNTTVQSAEVPLPVPLMLPPLPVPTLFVLCLDPDFAGAAAIYLPKTSASDALKPRGVPSDDVEKTLIAHLSSVLTTLSKVRETLSTVTWVVSFVTGLQDLSDLLSKVPHIDIKEIKNQESNLNDDDFIHYGNPLKNDREVEDESSSFLLIGLPGKQVQLFQDSSYGGMHFTAKTGLPMVVAIRNLASMPRVVAASDPMGGVIENTYTTSKTPNNSSSSMKWLQP